MRLKYISQSMLLLLMVRPVLCQGTTVAIQTPSVAKAVDANGTVQTSPSPQTTAPYSLSLSVNEVGIHFHASDVHNLPVLDLKPDEVDVFDDDSGPGQVVSMRHLEDRPIHASFIIDTSGSVGSQVARSRAEAQEAVQKLLMHVADEGTAVEFGRSRRVIQGWTNQKSILLDNMSHIGGGPRDPIDGTSIFDALFSTCFYEFGKTSSTGAANAVLLFTDGEDTASSVLYNRPSIGVAKVTPPFTLLVLSRPQGPLLSGHQR